MGRVGQPYSPFEFYDYVDNSHDFWRCYECGRILTYEEERYRVSRLNSDMRLTICDCGSMRFRATRPRGIEWIYPRVAVYVAKLVIARGIAPWLERRYPKALPLAERLSLQKGAKWPTTKTTETAGPQST